MIHGVILSVLITAQLNTLTYVGSLTDSLRAPARVAVAPDGTVLVTDPVNNRIARYDADDNFLGTWEVPQGPLGVAAHADGRYFVSLRDLGKVGIYDADFSFVSYLGDGDPLVNFVQPTDIEIASDTGYIYVVDGEGDKLYGFEPDGTVALVAGIRGGASGEFRYPSAVSVDEGNSRLLVADHDNFRVQAFTTGGVFDLHFGYRLKFPDDGGSEGWLPRTQGLAADADGNVYIADALMGTVRVFDETGVELAKALEYGTDPGDLRTPCDLALSNDGDRLYVVNTNNSAVEIYETPGGGWGGGLSDPWKDPQIGGDSGTNWSEYDAQRMNQRFRPNKRRLRPGGGGDLQEPGGDSDTGRSSYDGPHMIDSPVICGRCHGFPDLPGGHEGLVEGQANLCMSCHSSGGQGLDGPLHELDPADPYGTNPNAADFLGVSHAWGVAAVNADADSVGPPPGSAMELYLDDGNIKCSTCHNQHSDFYDPYLRMRNDRDQMCRECHAPRVKGTYASDPENNVGTHPTHIAYPDDPDHFVAAGDLANVILKYDQVECMSCHGVHDMDSGGANDGDGDGNLLRAANDAALCTSCHDGPDAPHVHGTVLEQSCTACHEAHGNTSNLWLIKEQVEIDLPDPVTVVFTDDSIGVGPGAFVDPDPAVFGICEGCHPYPSDNPGLDPPHTLDPPMGKCTACHTHHNGFKRPGSGDLPPEGYAGSQVCLACHSDTHTDWLATRHEGAWNTLDGIGQGENAYCMPCHTVGFGQPSGYVNQALTPDLDGVQCENCHGPAAQHLFDTSDPALRPNVDVAAEMCGSCHTGSHHPTIDEWLTSGHAEASAHAYYGSCDACHAPLGDDGGDPPVKFDVECVACHDPHAQTGNAANPDPDHDYQLLYPEVANPTPSNDPNVLTDPDRYNLCGQCHHSRGRTWEATERGPHHSLQANVYIGEMPVPDGVDLVPMTPSEHAGLELQCNTCHMYREHYESEDDPAISGHSWHVNFEACVDCHGSAEAAETLVAAVRAAVQARLDAIYTALGPEEDWEYSCCGGPPEGDGDGTQGAIPDDIKKVRFLYHYILGDASLGVHNGAYTSDILEAAEVLLGIPPGGREYVGSGACAACHGQQAADQNVHAHAHKLNPVAGAPPVYPEEGIYAGVPNTPDGATWDDVSYVIGGYYRKGRFITQSGNIMIGAVDTFDGAMGVETQWNLEFPANGGGLNWAWYHQDDTQPKPYNYSCFQCHTTGPVEGGGFEEWAEPGVMCEACHGPGSEHLFAPGPDTIDVDTSAAQCGTCHTRGDDNNVVIAKGGYIKHHEQYPELLASPHKMLDCVTCHEPHTSAYYDAENGITVACTNCHGSLTLGVHAGATFVRGDYTEELTCASCHMAYATKSATAGSADVIGPDARMGDIQTHMFNINTDPVDYNVMFTPDGSAVEKDVDGEGAVTLDFVCLRCHNGIGNAGDKTLGDASLEAQGYH